MPEFTINEEDCRYCQTAMTKPDFPVFHARCSNCAVRAMAQSPHFWKAEQKMGAADYKAALTKLFGADNWKAAHVEIMMEAQRIRKAREQRQVSAELDRKNPVGLF